MTKELTLGSLFDGSGGFPLAGSLSGIKPVWASEVEPFPIRVTTKRFPCMRHYGDITIVNGYELEPVDIITFGSPCQDMSIAGKRDGLTGERSWLFYKAIRIIKEMRENTNGKYPRFIVWENVPGAFSSNKREDFRCVVEEICKIKEEVSIPKPDKWQSAGCVVGNNYSVAWRTLDAQFWGVPQRRKRIYLVADFAGGSAGKILFESEGVSGYSSKSICPWKETARSSGEGTKETGFDSLMFENHSQDSRYTGPLDVAQTVLSAFGTGGNNQPFVVKHHVYTTSKSSYHMEAEEDVANTLLATDYKDPSVISEGPDYIVRRITPTESARLQGFPDWWCSGLAIENPTEAEIEFWKDVFETHRKVVGKSSRSKGRNQIIKWLKNPHSDSAEYKMWGNGIALPNAAFVLAGIAYYAEDNNGV